jgi:hypothetical protein
LKLGNERSLEEDDLYNPLKEDEIEYLTDELEKYYLNFIIHFNHSFFSKTYFIISENGKRN